jgi:hypothetical protein
MDRKAYPLRLRLPDFLEKREIRKLHTTKLDLFAGIPVADYAAALKWYERLLGSPPTCFPHDTEAVCELAEHLKLRDERPILCGLLAAAGGSPAQAA